MHTSMLTTRSATLDFSQVMRCISDSQLQRLWNVPVKLVKCSKQTSWRTLRAIWRLCLRPLWTRRSQRSQWMSTWEASASHRSRLLAIKVFCFIVIIFLSGIWRISSREAITTNYVRRINSIRFYLAMKYCSLLADPWIFYCNQSEHNYDYNQNLILI